MFFLWRYRNTEAKQEVSNAVRQTLASRLQQQLQGIAVFNKPGFEFSKPGNISHGLMRLQFNVKMQVEKLTFTTGRGALGRALSCGCGSVWEGETWWHLVPQQRGHWGHCQQPGCDSLGSATLPHLCFTLEQNLAFPRAVPHSISALPVWTKVGEL